MKTKDEEKPTVDEVVTYYSPSKLGGLVQVLMVSTIMGVLLIPVFLLFLVPMSHPMMAFTSTAFIFLFAVIMTVIAQGRIYEIFVGTATSVFEAHATCSANTVKVRRYSYNVPRQHIASIFGKHFKLRTEGRICAVSAIIVRAAALSLAFRI